MNSFGDSFGKAIENIGQSIERTLQDVTETIQRTGDEIADSLKRSFSDLSDDFSSMDSQMGNAGAKKSTPATEHSVPPTPNSPSRKIPPFHIAYGVNSAGKSVMYDIDVASMFPQLDETKVTVLDLQTYMSILTHVPVENQQLIYKGSHLHGDTLLISLGIREGAKMMMLGKIPVDLDEEIRKKMSAIEDEISLIAMGVMEVESKIPSNADGEISSVIKALRQKLLYSNEAFMKTLMKLDAVDIPMERTELRAQRKSLVTRVHGEMEKTDGVIKTCDELLTPSDATAMTTHEESVGTQDQEMAVAAVGNEIPPESTDQNSEEPGS